MSRNFSVLLQCIVYNFYDIDDNISWSTCLRMPILTKHNYTVLISLLLPFLFVCVPITPVRILCTSPNTRSSIITIFISIKAGLNYTQGLKYVYAR